ncbi:MAG TPA: hypothetical protein VMT38_03320 [Terracidiphilus sp.]|nr:hypothetical protein [Terracidiphilus sp.]
MNKARPYSLQRADSLCRKGLEKRETADRRLVRDSPVAVIGAKLRHIFAYTMPMHRVYMSFMQRQGWHCQFLEEDLKTALPKKLAFLSQDMLLELARRGGAVLNLEAEQAIRHGIDIGRGGVWLNLNEDQYRKLK